MYISISISIYLSIYIYIYIYIYEYIYIHTHMFIAAPRFFNSRYKVTLTCDSNQQPSNISS